MTMATNRMADRGYISHTSSIFTHTHIPLPGLSMQRRVVVQAILAMLGSILAVLVGFIFIEHHYGRSGTFKRAMIYINDAIFDDTSDTFTGPNNNIINPTQVVSSKRTIFQAGAAVIKKSFTVKVLLAFTMFMVVLGVGFAVYWSTTSDQEVVLPADPEDPGPDFLFPEDTTPDGLLENLSSPELQAVVLIPLLAILVVFAVLVAAGKMYGWAERHHLISFAVKSDAKARVVEDSDDKTKEQNAKVIVSADVKRNVDAFFRHLHGLPRDLSDLITTDFQPQYYTFEEKAPPPALEPVVNVMKDPYIRHDDQPVLYKRLHLLGKGTFGSVYAASSVSDPPTTVAMKEVRLDCKADSLTRKLTTREPSVLQAVHAVDPHHYYVKVHGVYASPDYLFMAMDRLTGRSMTSKDRVDGDTASVIAHQVLLAIDALHSIGYRHRDIKPENIFVTTSGQVKVLDLGLAGPVGEDVRCGTEGYWAVEMTDDITVSGLFTQQVSTIRLDDHTEHTLTSDDKWAILSRCRQSEAVDVYSIGSMLAAIYQPTNGDPQFDEFLRLTRHVQPWMRPTVASLLEHPFVTRAQGKTPNFGPLLSEL